MLRNRTGFSKVGVVVLHRMADRSVRHGGVAVTANGAAATFQLNKMRRDDALAGFCCFVVIKSNHFGSSLVTCSTFAKKTDMNQIAIFVGLKRGSTPDARSEQTQL